MTPSPRAPHILKTHPLSGVELFGGRRGAPSLGSMQPPSHLPVSSGSGAPAPTILAQPAQAPGRRGWGLSGLRGWRLRRWQVGRVTGKQKNQRPQTLGGVFGAPPGSHRAAVRPALLVPPGPSRPRAGCLGVSPHLPTSPSLVSACLWFLRGGKGVSLGLKPWGRGPVWLKYNAYKNVITV